MDFTTISQLIGSLGFPIVACIMLYIRMDKTDERHRDEMDKLTESLNNNTVALTKLAERLSIKDEVQ